MKLNYTYNLPKPSAARRLSAMGHPGYSETFAKQVLNFHAHNGNVFLSIQMAYRSMDA